MCNFIGNQVTRYRVNVTAVNLDGLRNKYRSVQKDPHRHLPSPRGDIKTHGERSPSSLEEMRLHPLVQESGACLLRSSW